MLASSYPYFLMNKPVAANQDLVVTDKYTGKIATRVALADAHVIDSAIAGAVRAADSETNCSIARIFYPAAPATE